MLQNQLGVGALCAHWWLFHRLAVGELRLGVCHQSMSGRGGGGGRARGGGEGGEGGEFFMGVVFPPPPPFFNPPPPPPLTAGMD